MTLIATEITNIQTPRFWNYFDNSDDNWKFLPSNRCFKIYVYFKQTNINIHIYYISNRLAMSWAF